MSGLSRVMCVEDDPDIRTILSFSLVEIGAFEVCMCASGLEAIERTPDFLPELVLLDVMMPSLTGPQTLEKLRALSCMTGVAVVFITAKAMAHEVEASLRHGAAGVIVKPFDPVALPVQVRNLWESSRDARFD